MGHTQLCPLVLLNRLWSQAAAESRAGFGVAHVPSESCLVFPPGHPWRHLESVLCVHIPSFCAIRKKGVGYGSKPQGGGK